MCFRRSFPVQYSVQARKTRVLNDLRNRFLIGGGSAIGGRSVITIMVIERRSLKARRGPDQVMRFVQKRRQSVRRLNVYDGRKDLGFSFYQEGCRIAAR